MVRSIIRSSMALAVVMAMVPQFVTAQTFSLSGGHVEFDSRVPLHSFTGKSDELTGRIDLEDGTIDFYIDLSTLKTGIGKRDKDMRRTLNVKEIPFAEFFGSIDGVFNTQSSKLQTVTVSGKFSIHGITKDVTVNGTMQMDGGDLLIEAAWRLSLKDYDIRPPRFLMFKVDDEQNIRISARLNPIQK